MEEFVLNNNSNLGNSRVLETSQTTISGIEFSKNNLFFRSIPNKIAFDTVKVKNIGTTCIYFKWQKSNKIYNLTDKKEEGIERFFCHYVIFISKVSLILNCSQKKKSSLLFPFFLKKMVPSLRIGY